MSRQSPLIVSVAGVGILLLLLVVIMLMVRALKRGRPEDEVDLENNPVKNVPSKDQAFRARKKEIISSKISALEAECSRRAGEISELEAKCSWRAREMAVLEAERNLQIKEVAALQSKLETAEQLQQRLTPVDTFPTALKGLLGEDGAEAFVREMHRSMQRTCSGVQNEIFTGFVANFYAASVVIRAGTLLGVPEEDGRVIRSLSCLGVKGKEKVCRHCHALSTTISKVMHDHGQRDSLAPISDFQRESLKEERHERRQRQMIPLTDKVFWPANIYTTQVMTTDKPPQLNTD